MNTSRCKAIKIWPRFEKNQSGNSWMANVAWIVGWDILIWWHDKKEKRKKKKKKSRLLNNLNNFLILIFFLKDHYISEFRLRAPRLPRLIWWTWPTHKNTQCLWVVAEIIRLWAMASRCDCWTCSVTLAYFIILFPYHLTAKF